MDERNVESVAPETDGNTSRSGDTPISGEVSTQIEGIEDSDDDSA